MVDEVYQTVMEEASAALCPSPSDPFYAQTFDESGVYCWKVADVEDCWALCQSLDESGVEETVNRFVNFMFFKNHIFVKLSIINYNDAVFLEVSVQNLTP